jgi:hypothetical protein
MNRIAERYGNSDVRILSDAGIVSRKILVMRSHEASHRFGIRTPLVLAVQDGHRRQFLYDLATDAEESRNLRAARPGVYATWIGNLTREVRSLRPATTIQSKAREVDPADLEALKALGYIK